MLYKPSFRDLQPDTVAQALVGIDTQSIAAIMPIERMTDEIRKLAEDFMSESLNASKNLISFEKRLPPFPSDKWSFRGKPEERVIVFDLSEVKKGEIPQEDLHYMLQFYERDDVVVLTKCVGSELLHSQAVDELKKIIEHV